MQGFKIPKQLATGLFTDIIVPSVGQNGYGAIWNNSTKKIEWAQFEAFGAVASGIATHVALSNPHSQYPLSSSLGTAAYLNVGTSANNIVQLNGSGFLPALNGSLLTNLPATTPGGSSGYIQYNNAGAFGASGVYWDAANSRVGIGTATPLYPLDIVSTVQVFDRIFSSGTVAVGRIFASGNNAANPTRQWGMRLEANNSFSIRDDVVPAIRLSIDSSGNVGIGTTSPGQKLDVNGSVNVATALIAPAIRPPSDSTYSIVFQNAAGNFNNVEIDTVNQALILKNSQTRMTLGGFTSDKRYFCIWIGNSQSATSSIANSVFNAIDDGVSERNVFFNAPGTTGKLFFRQNNGTYMSIQDARLQISTSATAIGDAGARLSVATDTTGKKGIVVVGATGQSANLQEWQNSGGTVQFGIGATGKILTNQAVTNTNTPSGATAKAMPIYDAAGTLLGYIPVYAAQW